MDFTLSYNNKEEVLVFPVVPNGGIQLSRDQDNQAFDGINHELQALGNMKLATFSITSFFPLKRYSFLRPYSSINGWHYVRVIEAVRKRKIPFRALHLDNNGQEVFNLPVTVENFEYWLDQAGDIGYTIDFKEYRFANGSAATLSKPKDAAGEKTQTAAQLSASTGSSSGGTFTKRYTENDAKLIARTMYGEARGIKKRKEVACIGWTILNRVDKNQAQFGKTIEQVVTKSNQFAYSAGFPLTSQAGFSLINLARDVLDRWSREKAGQTNVGRVLPKEYLWYKGDLVAHNYFFKDYNDFLANRRAKAWDYSLPSPYGD